MASRPVSETDLQSHAEASGTQTIAMDGHVHLQKEMPWGLIASNFASAAPGKMHVCLIVESHGLDRFAELEGVLERWGALGLRDRDTGLHFVAGRQIVSAEGLEILLIGSRDQSGEGLPADQVIANGIDNGAAICMPWGFGKWLGKRRKLAIELSRRFSGQAILGDITNRPSFWREPLFNRRRVLRGSDNLPLHGSSNTVGAFGSVIDSGRAIQTAEHLVAMLRDPAVELRPYGKRKPARISCGEQLQLRLARRGS